MTSRIPSVLTTLLLLAALAGCGGRPGGGVAADTTPSPEASSAGTYNSDQLTQALLSDIPGYQRSGVPQWGQYGSLAAVQNYEQMQQAVKLDKPECASATRAVSQEKAVRAAPSALVAFEKGRRQTVTETLMAVGPAAAAQQVRLRVPAACRTFKVKVGGHWANDTVVEPARGAHIGEGSRTAGVTTTVGATTVRTWFVVLRSRGYLATITLYGPGATRDEAERLARQAYQQAERILP
jgi:hypothetical protein